MNYGVDVRTYLVWMIFVFLLAAALEEGLDIKIVLGSSLIVKVGDIDSIS